jgi:hypothetical protein
LGPPRRFRLVRWDELTLERPRANADTDGLTRSQAAFASPDRPQL